MSNAPADRLSFVPRDLRSGTTYARARLRLGIASVGTLVVLSAVLLVLDVPDDLLPDSMSWAVSDVAWLVLLVGLYVGLSAPFDLLGGLVLPRRYGRSVVAEGFVRMWARGAAVHGLCLLVVALVLLAAGRAGGDGAALAAALVLMAGLLAAQVRLAGLVGGVRRDGDGLTTAPRVDPAAEPVGRADEQEERERQRAGQEDGPGTSGGRAHIVRRGACGDLEGKADGTRDPARRHRPARDHPTVPTSAEALAWPGWLAPPFAILVIPGKLCRAICDAGIDDARRHECCGSYARCTHDGSAPTSLLDSLASRPPTSSPSSSRFLFLAHEHHS